jgi:hypothetical protein
VEDAVTRIHHDDGARVALAVARVLSGEAKEFAEQYRIVRPDGSTCWLDAHGVMLQDDGLHMMGVGVDITGLKTIQRSLEDVGGALAIGFDEVWEDNVKVLRADCLPLLVGRVLSPEGGGQQYCQRHKMFHEAHELRRKCNKLVALYYRLRKSEGSCKICIFQILRNRTRNVEPWPGELSISIVAPCELAIHFARERPKCSVAPSLKARFTVALCTGTAPRLHEPPLRVSFGVPDDPIRCPRGDHSPGVQYACEHRSPRSV